MSQAIGIQPGSLTSWGRSMGSDPYVSPQITALRDKHAAPDPIAWTCTDLMAAMPESMREPAMAHRASTEYTDNS